MEMIRELQAYGFFFFVLFLVWILYGYCFHLYKSEKKGIRNYEKYANLALDDGIDSQKIESVKTELK